MNGSDSTTRVCTMVKVCVRVCTHSFTYECVRICTYLHLLVRVCTCAYVCLWIYTTCTLCTEASQLRRRHRRHNVEDHGPCCLCTYSWHLLLTRSEPHPGDVARPPLDLLRQVH